ncbi:MAG: hypothetical protein AAF244_02315 [Pseudomonadota bacterium]
MESLFPGYTGYEIRAADARAETFVILLSAAAISEQDRVKLTETFSMTDAGEVVIPEEKIQSGDVPDILFPTTEQKDKFLREAGNAFMTAKFHPGNHR